jgi:hypothetical protein
MGFNIEDEYNFRVGQIARLLALCGQDESQAATIAMSDLDGLIALYLMPESGDPTDTNLPVSTKQLFRVYYRNKKEGITHCYYRDILKARLAENG